MVEPEHPESNVPDSPEEGTGDAPPAPPAPPAPSAPDMAGENGETVETGEPARPDTPPPAGPTPSERAVVRTIWFVHANRERLGPFSTGEIDERLRDGTFLPKHYAWHIGFGDKWHRLRDIGEFRTTIESSLPATANRDAQASTDTLPPPPRTAAPAPADATSATGISGLACTNCLQPVDREWLTCPGCGFTLRAVAGSAWSRLPGEPVHRAVALGGAGLAVIALIMPWVHASTAAGAVTAIGGLMVPTGEILTLLAWLVLGLSLQSVAGGPHRALLTWLLALGAGLLAALVAVQVRSQDLAILATAAPGLSDARISTGVGWFVYAFGIGLVLLATLLPAIVRLLQRPLIGGATALVVVLFGFGVVQLINGTLYEPLLRIQLSAAGYDQATILRSEDIADGPRAERSPGVEVLHIRAWRDGRLYVGTHEWPTGSLWPLRSVRLQEVPNVDVPLFPLPEPGEPDGGAGTAGTD